MNVNNEEKLPDPETSPLDLYSFIEDILEPWKNFKKIKFSKFDLNQVAQLIDASKVIFSAEKTLLKINGPIIVAGLALK